MNYLILILILLDCRLFIVRILVSGDDFQSEKSREILRRAKAAEMVNYMDRNFNPCENFYKYTCGNWARVNPANKNSKTGYIHALKQSYDRSVKRFLDKTKYENNTRTEQMIKNFYNSCLTTSFDERNYRPKLMDLLEQYGGMPALKGRDWNETRFNWLELVATILRKYDKKVILEVHIQTDFLDSQRIRLYFGPMKFEETRYGKEERLSIQQDLQELLGMKTALAVKTSAEIAKFHNSLENYKKRITHEGNKRKKWKLSLLQDLSEAKNSSIDLQRYAHLWLGYDYLLPVYALHSGYYAGLKELIQQTPKSTIANYILWELLQEFRFFIPDERRRHEQSCHELTKFHFVQFFDFLIFNQTLKSYPDLIEETQRLWYELKLTFAELLSTSNSIWLSPKIRHYALEKLWKMKMEILSYEDIDFDEQYKQLTISEKEFFNNMLNIYMHRSRNYRQQIFGITSMSGRRVRISPSYIFELNAVLIPAAFLQYHYFWHSSYPLALKYATIGHAIAHEIAHGFDDKGSIFGARGNLINWWDHETVAAFSLRNKCFQRHYRQFHYAGITFNRENQAENLADNLGLQVAFTAYKYWLSLQNERITAEEELPTLKMTPFKMFFIANAQFWCADINQNALSQLLKEDEHPPEEIRVNALMSNFERFSIVFECKRNSEMNVKNKCPIF